MSKLRSTGIAEALPVAEMRSSGIEPSPRSATPPAIVRFPKWQRARDRACAALLAGENRLLVTGPAGTGKSTLLHEIARILRYTGWQVAVRIATLQTDGEQSAATALQSVLLVDEADRLSNHELEQLDREGWGAILLAGLDPIGSRWEAGARISLSALSPTEARGYIAEWMSIAGQALSTVEPSAIERVAELGAGVPRLLSSLLGGAIWMAAASGTEKVTRQHVEDAAALRACFLEEEGGAPPEAEGSPGSSVSAAQHDRERVKTDPKDASEPAKASVDAGQIHRAATLHDTASRRRGGMLVPALATCIVVLAGGAGAAVRTWPDETVQAAQAVLATVARHMSVLRQREPVAPTDSPGALALPAPEGQRGPEPAVEAVQFQTEISPPRGPERPATAELPMPAGSVTLKHSALERASSSGPVQDPAPEHDSIAPEPMSLNPAVSVEQQSSSRAESGGGEQIGPSPEQQEAAPIGLAEAMSLAPAGLPGASASATARPQSEEGFFVQPQGQSGSPGRPDNVAAGHAQLARAPAPEPQTAVGSRPELAPASISPAAVTRLLARGDALIAIGDIAAARLVYQRAVTRGSELAATAMGKTYDPGFLGQIGAIGVLADPEAAAAWYRKAAALSGGNPPPLVVGTKTGQ